MNRQFNSEEAALYLGITELELDCYTKLGWVKQTTLSTGDEVYSEAHLERFMERILKRIQRILGL